MSTMSLITLPSCTPWKSVSQKPVRKMSINCNNDFGAKSFFLSPSDERILKKALKEPVAFMGGMFAGLLRLDLNEDPLKEWVTRTVEASGITEEEVEEDPQESPQQIQIE